MNVQRGPIRKGPVVAAGVVLTSVLLSAPIAERPFGTRERAPARVFVDPICPEASTSWVLEARAPARAVEAGVAPHAAKKGKGPEKFFLWNVVALGGFLSFVSLVFRSKSKQALESQGKQGLAQLRDNGRFKGGVNSFFGGLAGCGALIAGSGVAMIYSQATLGWVALAAGVLVAARGIRNLVLSMRHKDGYA